MWSVLAAAWRIVVRRVISYRVILAATEITILLATVLLAAGPIYTEAVTFSAVQKTLADVEPAESNVTVSARVTRSTYPATDDEVSAEVTRVFALTGADVLRRGTSDSYALPGQPGGTVTDVAIFRFFEQIEDHVTVIAGSWPVTATEPHQIAVSEPAASRLHLSVGDELTLANQRSGGGEVTVQVSATFRLDDPRDPFWYGDELDINGISRGRSFTTYGPLVAPRSTFLDALTPLDSELEWRVYPAHEHLEVAAIPEFRSRIAGLEDVLNRGRQPGERMGVDTGLTRILSDTERSLLVTRSTVLILTLQFSLLAGYALVLTARLLADSRRNEIELMRSRGGASGQVVAMAVMEGALLTVPAAIAAPALASTLLRAFNHVGPLAAIGLTIDPVANLPSYLLAGAAAAACLTALVLPAFGTARAFGNISARRARQESKSLVQRAGLDLVLLGLAGIALWQLHRYGTPLTNTIQGGLDFDPLLVTAPALGMLAGAVAALRSLPLLSRAADAATSGSTMVIPVLGTWQLARRPRRYARAALFLTLATATGIFAIAYAGTWRTSQAHQAAFEIGTDVRDDPAARLGSGFPVQALRDAYDDIPGFIDAVPVLRQSGALPGSTSTVRFVILDAARAGDAVAFRPDLADVTIGELMTRLAEARFEPAGAPLPGEPERIALDVTFRVEPLGPEVTLPQRVRPSRVEFAPRLRAVLVDGDGQVFRVDLGPVTESDEPVSMIADLGLAFESLGRLRPAYPLSIAGIELRSDTPEEVTRQATLVLSSIQVSPDRDGSRWQPVPVDLDPDSWTSELAEPRFQVDRPGVSFLPARPGSLALRLISGATAGDVALPAFFLLRPAGDAVSGPLPLLMSADLMEEAGLELGDGVSLGSLPGFDGTGVIVGVVDEFPTVHPDRGEPVVLDYQSFLAARLGPGASTPLPDEMWLSIDEGSAEEALSVLVAPPFSTTATLSRTAREATLEADPVARGSIGSLLLGFAAAAALAGLGFAVNAAMSMRERQVEFALLRAAGLSQRQLVAWLAFENGILVAFGVLAGTALGLLLSWLVLPLVTITQSAAQVVPDLVVVYPWPAILWIGVGSAAVLLVSVALLSATARRMRLGTLLRLGTG